MSKNEPFQFTKGMDQSVIPYRSDLGSFWFLQNCRMSPDIAGEIEQTPYFNLFTTLARGTYWDGTSSLTEPATSAVRGVIRDIYVTDYVYKTAADVQIQCFQQVTQPATETIYTGCLLTIQNLAGFGINLGSTLDVEMTGVATFRWRKNGGGYTAGLVPSTAGVSIDGGTATLYFLAATGYAGTETWSWRRSDCSVDHTSTGTLGTRSIKPTDWAYYKGTLFFRNNNNRIMTCKWAVTDGKFYIVTAGYRAVYGDSLTFFDDHMIVSRYSTGASVITSAPKAKTVGWSDKTDVENFIPTDTNEADSYVIPNVVLLDTANTNGSDSLVESVTVLKQQLFIVTTYEIYYSPALGLPTVFSFRKFMDMPKLDATSTINVLEAKDRVYIWTQSGLYTFDGGDLSYIGAPIKPYLYIADINRNQIQTPTAGTYNRFSQEVCFSFTSYRSASQPFILVYSEITKQFHIRASDLSNDVQPVTSMAGANGSLTIGGTSRTVYTEDSGYQNTPAFDYTDGTAYATPTITFQVLSYGTLRQEKEVTSVYIAASVTATTSNYSTSANLKLDLAYRDCPDGLITGSATTDSTAVWDSSLVSGNITLRRAFRGLSFEIQARGAVAGKPPGKFCLTALEPQVRLPENLLDR